jgi:hypothetical protein
MLYVRRTGVSGRLKHPAETKRVNGNSRAKLRLESLKEPSVCNFGASLIETSTIAVGTFDDPPAYCKLCFDGQGCELSELLGRGNSNSGSAAT